MAKISYVDLKKIDIFLTPPSTEKGYILDFSNASLREFIKSITEIDIYEEGKYDNYGTSKANRIKSFLKKESNDIVSKVLLELVEYQKTLDSQYSSLKIQADRIIEIAHKLEKDVVEEDSNITVTVHFKKIREQILSELEKAEFTIWIAVAWFTDPVLFDCLIRKKARGLNIQIIIHNDDINNSSNLNYSQFETYKLNSFGLNSINKMHHKFCIIDFKTIVHGSYNWTKVARYNGETIEILDRANKAKQFSQEFMKLKSQAMNQ